MNGGRGRGWLHRKGSGRKTIIKTTTSCVVSVKRLEVERFIMTRVPFTVADPGFPRVNANPRGGANLLFGRIYAQNCVKMEKNGLR